MNFVDCSLVDSKTIMDTLEFTNQYNIPAINASGDCIGMFNVMFYNNHWTINSYREGVDFLAAVNSMPSDSVCFIEIPQLGEEFGFLGMSNSEETYNSITQQQTVYSDVSISNILSQIVNETSSENVDSEGGGNSVPNNFTPYFATIIFIILIAILSTIGVLRLPKK